MDSMNNAESASASQDAVNESVTAVSAQPEGTTGATAKPADARVFVQVHSTDVEAIRAVLALTPTKRKGFPMWLWLGLTLALLVGAFASWQWMVSTTQTAENIAPPLIAAPKPPDFAFAISAPNPPTQPMSTRSHSRHGRGRSAGN
ncbi:MAG: hypothetical protein WAK91_16935 [Candidatus Acidiferrales bacterium]|jgi:hypothetical protein